MSITLETLLLLFSTIISAITAVGALYMAWKKFPSEARVLQADAAQDQANVIESSAKSAQQWLDVFAMYRADRIKTDEENISLRRRLATAEDEIKQLRFQFDQKVSGETALVEENKRLNAGVAELKLKITEQEHAYELEKVSHMNEIGQLHFQLKDLQAKFDSLTQKATPT